MSGEIVSVKVDRDHVELVVRHPLWSAIPIDQRVTEDEVHEHHRYRDTQYERDDIEILRLPRCIVANRQQALRGKWMPCKHPVAEGEQLCKTHGGQSARKLVSAPTRAELLAEIERLRAALDTPQ